MSAGIYTVEQDPDIVHFEDNLSPQTTAARLQFWVEVVLFREILRRTQADDDRPRLDRHVILTTL